MKKKYLLLIFTLLIVCSRSSYGQMVGVNIYLPGHYLEIGMNNTSSFGAPDPAASMGYHPYCASCGYPGLAEVYDYGHDGWAVGVPALYGDYTLPGSPYEGWEIQVNGVRNQAFTTGTVGTISGPGTLTGANVSYVNAGGQLIGNWAGTASGGNLVINQQTAMDTNGNSVIVTTTFKNTSASPIANIYYTRGCDPDNDEAHGGSFATNNTILHQNEDANHSVEADAEGALYGDHWSLCTKDCRAKAFFYTSWPIGIGVDLADVYTETASGLGTSQYTLGGTLDGDNAFGLIFNIGTIAAGDSAVISYAYVFNDAYSTIDSAFPDPTLVVNGVAVPNAPLPSPTIDTFNTCLYSGLTTVPVSINYGETGDWTWGSWTWAPTTGLASDTGVNNTINLSTISTAITYTITGSDSSLMGTTCNHKVFYLTILVCNSATNNSPCVGDTLQLVEHGDSTAATYFWYGPGGYVSTQQNPYIYPATFANSGVYHVVKTVDGVSDTGQTTVNITQPPSPGVTGNTVYCQNVGPFVPVTIITLPGAVPQWYTSPTDNAPTGTEPPVDLSNPGTYTAYVGQLDSTCQSLREPVVITVNPTPAAPDVTNPVYCLDAPTSALTATGISHTWYGPGIASSGTTIAPIPSSSTPVIDSYYVTQTVLSCISNPTLDRVIILTPPAGPLAVDTAYCQFSASVPLTATGVNNIWYGPGIASAGTTVAPIPPTNVPGMFTWFVTQSTDTLGVTCQSGQTPSNVDIVYLPKFTITAPAFVCQYDSINLNYTGPALNAPGYSWVLPEGAFIVDQTLLTTMPSIVVQFDSANQNNYVYLTASDNEGFCQTTDTIRINVVPQPAALAYSNPNVCQGDTTSLSLSYRTPNAANFVWTINGADITSGTAGVNIVTSGSNSGGPYSITWNDSGTHVIELNTTTQEGCPSLPSYDTVLVHNIPDASFTYVLPTGTFCIQDSVLFKSINTDYNNLYTWGPASSFNNINKTEEWGRVNQEGSVINLTVTSVFGCTNTTTQTLTPGSCCTVAFPNAFTPGGTINKLFRPIAAGYHLYHEFTVSNRWGQIVFASNSSEVAWDGTYNGVPQDGGVYFYYVKFDCGGNTVEQKGDVTLIR